MQGDQYWTPGTEMVITLHREDWDGQESSQHLTIQATVVRCGPQLTGFSIALVDEKRIASSDAFDEFLRVRRRTMEEFLADLQTPKPHRCLPVSYPKQRPLLLSERTELLLEIARSYRLSSASEMWYRNSDDASILSRGHQK